jgi:hypothetical protein
LGNNSHYLHHNIIGRGPRCKVRSVIAAASYRAGVKLIEERTGERHDYTRKQGVLHDEIATPKGAPSWAINRAELWNRLDYIEDRSTRPETAQLAHGFAIALPHELTLEQQIFLMRDYVREQFTRKGFVADWVIHAPSKDGDKRNYHAHVLVPLRQIVGAGFSNKPRTFGLLDQMVTCWRKSWLNLANRHLARYGIAARIGTPASGVDPVAPPDFGAAAKSATLGNRKEEIFGNRKKNVGAECGPLDKTLTARRRWPCEAFGGRWQRFVPPRRPKRATAWYGENRLEET